MPIGDEQGDLWREIERELREALAVTNLRQTSALQIEEFLDHNELGVAFQALVEELDARHSNVPPSAITCLRSALEQMGSSSFDADCLGAWERVQARSAT